MDGGNLTEWKNIRTKEAILKKQLITVPACSTCNSSRTLDDEYAWLCISMVRGQNGFGSELAISKLKKKPELGKKLALHVVPVDFFGIEMGTFEVDLQRLMRWAVTVCRGLWFYKHRVRPSYPVYAVFGEIRTPDHKIVREVDVFHEICSKEINTVPFEGENPEIFTFRTLYDQEREFLLAEMYFYGGIRIEGVSFPGIRPTNLQNSR